MSSVTKLTSVPAEVVMIVMSAGVLLFGFYLELYENLIPCPLCLVQRVFYVLVLFTNLSSLLLFNNPDYKIVCFHISSLFSLIGAAVAGRQIWMQRLPADEIPECGPSLTYLLDIYPFQKVLELIYHGSGTCAEVVWQFLGLSIAEWSILFFGSFSVTSIISAHHLKRSQKIVKN